MSAERLGEEPLSGTQPGPEKKLCRFQQKTPIPSYLIALVVGALDSRYMYVYTFTWSYYSAAMYLHLFQGTRFFWLLASPFRSILALVMIIIVYFIANHQHYAYQHYNIPVKVT
jgi:hypothetical protein